MIKSANVGKTSQNQAGTQEKKILKLSPQIHQNDSIEAKKHRITGPDAFATLPWEGAQPGPGTSSRSSASGFTALAKGAPLGSWEQPARWYHDALRRHGRRHHGY